MSTHTSVLKVEAANALELQPGGIYLDLTFGGGGHTLEILKVAKTTVIAFELERRAIEEFAQKYNLSRKDNGCWEGVINESKVVILNKNFVDLKIELQKLNVLNVDGILADLGWSSTQLSSISGLSYQREEEELDMRLGNTLNVKAKDLLNALGKRELSEMFAQNSDIFGKLNVALVGEILSSRKIKRIESVSDLNQIILKVSKADNSKLKSQVYQALRIAVNQELDYLEQMLNQAYELLAVSGNLAVITFHSGEERIVAHKFSLWVELGMAKYFYDQKYTQPSVTELKQNIRAHSAKLWVISKVK